jgi:uncharacterized protein YggE
MLSIYRRASWQIQLTTIVVVVAVLVIIGFLGLQQFQAGDPENVSQERTTVDVGGAAAISLPQGERPFGLHVIGEGEVVVTPDRSIVMLGVSASADTAAEAAGTASATVESLIEAIRGVSSSEDEIQIQTTGISLSPVFPPLGPITPARSATLQRERSPEPIGYRSSNTITVTIDRLDITSNVLDAALGAGANTVRSVTFALQDDGPAKASALRLAVLDAAAKARVVADALQGSVRGVISMTEEFVNVPVARGGMFAEAATVRGSVPVEPGELRIRAVVRANFAYE